MFLLLTNKLGCWASISVIVKAEHATRLDHVTSNWKEIARGCAQESSLGPLLWNVYQNDIFYVNRRSQLSANADVHQLYFSCRELSNTGTKH